MYTGIGEADARGIARSAEAERIAVSRMSAAGRYKTIKQRETHANQHASLFIIIRYHMNYSDIIYRYIS